MSEQQRATIVGRRPAPTRTIAPHFVVMWSVLYVGAIVYFLWRGQYFLPISYGILGVLVLLRRIRPPTVVSAGGILRPWRWTRRLTWEQVSSVAAREPGTSVVRLNLTNGRSLALDDISHAESVEVAAIGGKHIRPGRAAVAPRSERERSDDQITADVMQQTKESAEQRRQMADDARRLRGRD